MRSFHYIIATGFGAGYSPTAPGTAGTILALLTSYFFIGSNLTALLIITAIFWIVGTISADFVEKDSGKGDPSIVVVDEMIGMWIGLILVPIHWLPFLVAFGLFRLFDVTKLFPIDNLQNLPGGWGIMMDDVGAGIYTFIIMQLLLYFDVFTRFM